MRIGLLADTHDRVPAIADLAKALIDGGSELILHAGDYCSPFAIKPLLEAGIPFLGVFGRNDGDHESLRATAALGMGAELYESPHSIDVSGDRILLVHDIGEVNRRSVESHGIVVHGCSHEYAETMRGSTLIVNPGEGCGWLSGTCSAAILDLSTKRVERLTL
jgi:uncharacterized protein